MLQVLIREKSIQITNFEFPIFFMMKSICHASVNSMHVYDISVYLVEPTDREVPDDLFEPLTPDPAPDANVEKMFNALSDGEIAVSTHNMHHKEYESCQVYIHVLLLEVTPCCQTPCCSQGSRSLCILYKH